MIHRYETFNCKIRALNGGINCKIIKIYKYIKHKTNERKFNERTEQEKKRKYKRKEKIIIIEGNSFLIFMIHI